MADRLITTVPMKPHETVIANVRALRAPLAGATLFDREGARTRLVLASLAITAATLSLSAPDHYNWSLIVAAGSTATLIAAGSLTPACWPILNRIGGVLLAGSIAALVAATGGADSPYRVFYGMLLVYATIFYGTRRLRVTAGLLLALYLAPHLLGRGDLPTDHWVEVGTELGVWSAMGMVTHGLVHRLRSESAELEASEHRYRSLFSENPNAVFTLDPQGRFTRVNAAGAGLVGTSVEALLGKNCRDFVSPDAIATVDERLRLALSGVPQQYELVVVDVAGSPIHARISNFPVVVDDAVVGVHGVVEDISDRKALEEDLAHAALHDSLTGLANRSLLAQRLQEALDTRERTGSAVAVLVFDLDGFKAVNDTHGHQTGDALLVELAARLRADSRPGDTVARLGGDEFAVVLIGADVPSACEVAERVLATVSRPVRVGNAVVSVGTSMGVAVADQTSSPAQLLRDADTAMYRAKRTGRGHVVAYRAELDLTPCQAANVDVNVRRARAWAAYINDLRGEIAGRTEAGTLPRGTRAPASVHRVLEVILAEIDSLPPDQTHHRMHLPERAALEEFIFHQTLVHAWADRLVTEGVLHVRRPPQADQFWRELEHVVLSSNQPDRPPPGQQA